MVMDSVFDSGTGDYGVPVYDYAPAYPDPLTENYPTEDYWQMPGYQMPEMPAFEMPPVWTPDPYAPGPMVFDDYGAREYAQMQAIEDQRRAEDAAMYGPFAAGPAGAGPFSAGYDPGPAGYMSMLEQMDVFQQNPQPYLDPQTGFMVDPLEPLSLRERGIESGAIRGDYSSVNPLKDYPGSEYVVNAFGDVAAGLGKVGTYAIPALGSLDALGVNVPEVARTAGETVAPRSYLDLATAGLFGAAGVGSGLRSGEGLLRAGGRGLAEAFLADPTSPGGLARAIDGGDIPRLGTSVDEARQMFRQGAEQAFSGDPRNSVLNLAGAADGAADNLRRFEEWNASDITEQYKASLAPTERAEYGNIYTTVRAGMNSADPETNRGWAALADELQRTPYQVARGEMSASEALSTNRFLFDNTVGGLTPESFARFVDSPEFAAMRPEAQQIALSAAARREATAAFDPNMTPAQAAQRGQEVASNPAVRAAVTVNEPVEKTIPDWVAARMRGEAADVPVEVRQGLLAEAQRLGLQVDPQAILRGTTQVVEDALHLVEIAAEAERRLNLGSMGRATEDYFAALRGETRKVEMAANAAKEASWKTLGTDAGPYKIWTRFNETIANTQAGRGAPLTQAGRAGSTGRGLRMPGAARPAMAGAKDTGIIDGIVNIINLAFLPFGFDLSSLGRQLLPSLANPFTAGTAWPAALKGVKAGLSSEDTAKAFMANLVDKSTAVNTKGVKFELSGAGGLVNREGPFTTDLAGKIPGARRFNDAYNLSINAVRVALTDRAVKNMPKMTPAQAQDIANMYTRFTGRGNFGPADRVAARALGPLFTSLRFMAAVPQSAMHLNPVNRLPDGKFDVFGPGWKEAAKAHSGFFITVAGAMSAASYAGFEVGLDPRGQLGINIGDEKNPQWVDISGGWAAPTKAVVQGITGDKIVAGGTRLDTNYPRIIGKDEKGNYRGVVAEYLRNRVGPAPQLGVFGAQQLGVNGKASEFLRPEYWDTGVFGLGGNTGKDIDLALQFVVPLWIQDVAQAVRMSPEGKALDRGAQAAFATFFGLSTQAWEVSDRAERAIDRGPLIESMISGGQLPGVPAGTRYEALTNDEKGKVNALWAEQNPQIQADITKDAREKGDIFQLSRDMREAAAEAKTTTLNTLFDQLTKGEAEPRDVRQAMQDIRGAVKDSVAGIYENPDYKSAVAGLEKSQSIAREPGNFFDDAGKWLKGEATGTPLPTPGIAGDLVEFYYSLPEMFKGADGKIDWDTANEVQKMFIDGLKGVDEQAATRLQANVEPTLPHPLEQLYFTVLDFYPEYRALLPPEGQKWSQADFNGWLGYLQSNPEKEAMMYLMGYRQDVVTKEAADFVHQLAPGQDVNIKKYR